MNLFVLLLMLFQVPRKDAPKPYQDIGAWGDAGANQQCDWRTGKGCASGGDPTLRKDAFNKCSGNCPAGGDPYMAQYYKPSTTINPDTMRPVHCYQATLTDPDGKEAGWTVTCLYEGAK